MQLCISLPAVLLWGQPHEETKKTKNEGEDDEFVEKNENNNSNIEEVVEEETDDYNMFTDVCFWAWLFGTTFWSLGKHFEKKMKIFDIFKGFWKFF